MDKIKINLDRTKLSSEYIQSKQNFTQITSQALIKSSLFKSAWFYGGAGIASIAGILFIALNSQKKNTYETKITLAKNELTTKITQISQINSPPKDAGAKGISSKPISQVDSRTELSDNLLAKSSSVLDNEKELLQVGTSHAIAQPIEIAIETKHSTIPKKNRLPNISGFYSGELPLEKLCSKGIEVNEEVQILSFKIQYATVKGDKFLTIQGAHIPSKICKDISELGIDQMIFLTEILGKNETGKIMNFTPMNFTCLIEE